MKITYRQLMFVFIGIFILGVIITLAASLSGCVPTVYRYQMITRDGIVFLVDAYRCTSYPAESGWFSVVCEEPGPDGDPIPMEYDYIVDVEMVTY